MKNLTTLIFFFSLFIPVTLTGQDCIGSFTEHYLNGNNIRASFFARGNKFTDGENPLFYAPYSADHPVSSIFASTPWIGGFDDAGNLRMAGETYPNAVATDYRVGPLTSLGTPYESLCHYFDKVWSVYSEEVHTHIADFMADGIIDDTIASIFAWPGNKNPHSVSFNGFELPADNGSHWAPFFDYNSNGIYDPDHGDYPTITLQTKSYIPDQMMWMVFNDVTHHGVTFAESVRVEIQLTAYAFHCENNEMLNNTIFNSYKLINRSIISLDSFYFGLWADYDLGCPYDDYMGVDTTRHTEFIYNSDPDDGDNLFDCSSGAVTYANKPPVQSMTYLNHPINSFITYGPGQDIGIGMHNALRGVWPDGKPITAEGNGNEPGSTAAETKFLFHGDPRDTASWSAINEISDKDFKTVSSVRLGRWDPGEITRVDLAYMYHYNPERDHLGQITTMEENIDELLATIDNLDQTCVAPPVCEEEKCVWPGDLNHDGIADHFDLLTWGVMNEGTGSARGSQVNWRGYFSDDWSKSTNDGVNYKHGDASGNGQITFLDLDVNSINYLSTAPWYQNTKVYPQGPELVLTSNPMLSSGQIPYFRITTGRAIQDVLGIAYEIEFDTAYFDFNSKYLNFWPADSNSIIHIDGSYEFSEFGVVNSLGYAFVQADHQEIAIDSGFLLQRSYLTGLTLKPGLTLDDLPNTTTIRLRNLIAIDAEGNNLNIGANELVVQKYGITAVGDLDLPEISLYPNPASDKLFIDAPHRIKAELINPQGQVLMAFLTGDDAVDVSGFAPGVYFLRFQNYGIVRKVVIE